ncbi:MAG: hypothetical protein MSQ05_01285 [Akkermansia sp.]|nr:hypothetical protein [Akkermansia sp.]
MVAGIPEAVAGYASTGGGVYLRGPYDLRRRGVHRRPLRCDCLPCLPWCGHSGGGGRARLRGRCGAPPAAYDLAAAWCTCGAHDLRRRGCAPVGPCGVIACPACHGAGIPEAVAGRACAGGWCACGRMISGGVVCTCGALRRDCPAVAVMVRARRGR